MLIVLALFAVAVFVKNIWVLLGMGQTLREVEDWHNRRENIVVKHVEIDSVELPWNTHSRHDHRRLPSLLR